MTTSSPTSISNNNNNINNNNKRKHDETSKSTETSSSSPRKDQKLSSAPTTTTTTSKKEQKPKKIGTWDKCICSTHDCGEISKLIETLAPKDHVWNAPKFEIRLRTVVPSSSSPSSPQTEEEEKEDIEQAQQVISKHDIFLESARQHLKPMIDLNIPKKTYFIARHHFMEALLVQKIKKGRNITTLIAPTEAKKIDNPLNPLLVKDQNIASTIWKRLKSSSSSSKTTKDHNSTPSSKEAEKTVLAKMGKSYVQAPCQPLSEVRDFIKYLQSGRGSRKSVGRCPMTTPTNNNNYYYNNDTATNNNNKNTNNAFHPAFQFPTVARLRAMVVHEYETSQNGAAFEKNENACQAMYMLSTYHHDSNPIPLVSKKYKGLKLQICPFMFQKERDNCYGYEIRQKSMYGGYHCPNCQAMNRLEMGKQKRAVLRKEQEQQQKAEAKLIIKREKSRNARAAAKKAKVQKLG